MALEYAGNTQPTPAVAGPRVWKSSSPTACHLSPSRNIWRLIYSA